MSANAVKLARVQEWLGIHTLGVYLGIETYVWGIEDFKNYIDKLVTKPDVVYVKVGEWGREWYAGHFADIRALFIAAGIGCAPYLYARPQTWSADAAIAARVATVAGGVVLDCEQEWSGNSGLTQFINRVRTLAGPGPRIMVTGYGDPTYAVPNWDFSALAEADAYQPQWYIGYWDLYHTRGWHSAIDWGDGQCYQRFIQSGLGGDYPIAPLINVENVAAADLLACATYLKAWQCSLAVWEARDITNAEISALMDTLHAQ